MAVVKIFEDCYPFPFEIFRVHF